MSKLSITLLAGLLAVVAPFVLLAENSTSIPGYTIHHNAFTTDMLSPAVASAYRFQRSKNRGMLNVSVIKDIPGTLGESVAADVKAHAANLTGQTREIPMREIQDADAIYYVGDFRVANQETLDFVLTVTPKGAPRSYTAKLRQQFFTK